MSKVNSLLEERFKKNTPSPKMAVMASQSAKGTLTSFTGIFSATELNAEEKEELKKLLEKYASASNDLGEDLHALSTITSEVRSIHTQAIMLHGERIKKAQSILKNYQEGAFTAWLVATYGNRQTPYNFLQFYEFHQSLPKELQTQVETMPKQVIYTLASREGSSKEKQRIVENYHGESKKELLSTIRKQFPLSPQDKRQTSPAETIINLLNRVLYNLSQEEIELSDRKKQKIHELLAEIQSCLK